MDFKKVRKLGLCAAVGIAGVVLGCGGGETCAGSSDGLGGGTSVKNPCTWDGTGGGTTIPDCSMYRHAANFVGTVDGKDDYDNLFTDVSVSDVPNSMKIQELDMLLPSGGDLHLQWPRPTLWGAWLDVTGTLTLPLGKPRAVLPGSKLRLKCGAPFFQYILHFEGGDLTACSVE